MVITIAAKREQKEQDGEKEKQGRLCGSRAGVIAGGRVSDKNSSPSFPKSSAYQERGHGAAIANSV